WSTWTTWPPWPPSRAANAGVGSRGARPAGPRKGRPARRRNADDLGFGGDRRHPAVQPAGAVVDGLLERGQVLGDRGKGRRPVRALRSMELEGGPQAGTLPPRFPQLASQALVVLLDELQARPQPVSVVQVRGDDAANQVLAFFEPSIHTLPILQAL